MTLLLIRHGQSVTNLSNTFAGQWAEVELSPLGYRQAQAAADYIAARYDVDVIYSSDLTRAIQTAMPLSIACSTPVLLDRELREINVKKWQGRDYGWIAAHYPGEYAVYKNDFGRFQVAGCESTVQMTERIMRALRHIADEHSDEGCSSRTVAVFTHATTLRAANCVLRGIAPEKMNTVPFPGNASITEVKYDGARFELVFADKTDYLGDMCSTLEPEA